MSIGGAIILVDPVLCKKKIMPSNAPVQLAIIPPISVNYSRLLNSRGATNAHLGGQTVGNWRDDVIMMTCETQFERGFHLEQTFKIVRKNVFGRPCGNCTFILKLFETQNQPRPEPTYERRKI